MSDDRTLLQRIDDAMLAHHDQARAAALAMAEWLEGRRDCDLAYDIIRTEVERNG